MWGSVALSGLEIVALPKPRASPWAFLFHSFGVGIGDALVRQGVVTGPQDDYLLLLAGSQFPNPCQMLIIVFGYELQQIHQPHRNIEPGVMGHTAEVIRIEPIEAVHP